MDKGIFSLISTLTLLLSLLFIYEVIVAEEPASATATISVNPLTSKAEVGQTFTININISDVVDLYGWEFKLRWNSALLDVLTVTEGPFLKPGGHTFFRSKINNTEGSILADCTLLDDVPGVSGDGILATVTFYVEVAGESILDLYDTILVNSQELPITHTSIDGYYYTPMHDVAVIDLSASETTVLMTAENQGTEIETFDVSAYYTRLVDPLIGTQTITLLRGANTTLTFPWTPPSSGRYEIRAEASAVPGEIDTADNARAIIISIGHSSVRSSSSESVNGYHIATTLFALFATAIIIPEFQKKKRPQVEIPTILKQNLPNNPNNLWNDWIRRQFI